MINLNGSDRSSWLTFFSTAPAQLGRRPKDGGPPFWGQMFTDVFQLLDQTCMGGNTAIFHLCRFMSVRFYQMSDVFAEI